MKSTKNFLQIISAFVVIISFASCKKFADLNKDPNNITNADAAPDYLMANVLIQSAKWYGDYGSGDMSGAVQHTVQDAWGNSYSQYSWDPKDWTTNYGILRDNKLMLQTAQNNQWNFHQGVGLIMRAFNMGVIADFWGDAPDSMALKGDQAGKEFRFPVFDSQESIYDGVIADLKAAIPLLAGTQADHAEITAVTSTSDVYYHGDPEKWSRFAYSLLLRYYLRLSNKRNVQSDVEAIASKVFQDNDDDCTMDFSNNASYSYQKAHAFKSQSDFDRNKMCATLVKKLDALKDPRIVIMAEPIVIRSVVDASKFTPGDNTTPTVVVGGVRYINPAAAAATKYKEFNIDTYQTDRPWGAPVANVWNFFDTSPTYVGIPISYSPSQDFAYNLNGSGTQSTSNNNYVSYMRRDIYDNPVGPLLKERVASYAEICFDLAEAAQKGWNVGHDAEYWYNKGVEASFDRWTVFSDYQSDVDGYAGCVKSLSAYMAQPLVAYDGTLQRIMEQKWIASWQGSCEAYMDWRRTGLPELHVGWASYREQIPVRFAYENKELQNNPDNSAAAIEKLEASSYNGPDGKNSPWSKTWLIQGTSKPW